MRVHGTDGRLGLRGVPVRLGRPILVVAAAVAVAVAISLATSPPATHDGAGTPITAARTVKGPGTDLGAPSASHGARALPPDKTIPGEADAAWASPDQTAPRHGNRPDRDRRWRARMDLIDQQARTALGLDDATAHQLDFLQRRLRALKQDVRDHFGPDGLSREQVAARIEQRIGGFRAQVVKLLGAEHAETYLRIVEDARTVPSAPVAQD
jgi:hypothetical protein